MTSDAKFKILGIPTALLIVAVLAVVPMYGCPKYNVWQQEMTGRAELTRARENRKIKIEEAEAVKESAGFLAEAEVIQARGVAEANKIIGDSLRDNTAYLRYLWIKGLQDGSSEVIYIPTEANLPILEARNKDED